MITNTILKESFQKTTIRFFSPPTPLRDKEIEMKKHILLSLSMFIFLLIMPFNVQAEEPSQRVMIVFHDKIDYQLLDESALEVHHIFEDYEAVSATIPVSSKEDLLAHSSVRLIEEDSVVKTNTQTSSWGYQTLKVEAAKSSGYTGKGVKIGIIDTGIRVDHPDLNIAGGLSFVEGTSSYNDDQGHGTHVAGIIAALDNEIGTVGVAPDAQIYAIKALDSSGEGNQSDVVAAINWAIEQQMNVINLSVTSPDGSYLLEETLQKAYDHGILIVAASGNAIAPLYGDTNVLYPARYETVLAVGSVDSNLKRSSFSYFGSALNFVAPGEHIYSTFTGDNGEPYSESTGTSMAAPFVTGVAALYKEAYPLLSIDELRARMERAALDLGEPGKDNEYGYGLIQPPSNENTKLFSDVEENSWYANEVYDLYQKGIINGYEDGGFHPFHPVTRAEAVAMLCRALELSGEKGDTNFSDVPFDHFASGYINQATNANIITGFQDETFKPSDNIIRGDVAVILQRAFQYPNSEESFFEDVGSEKHYYDAANSLASQNISKGYQDGTFKPDLNISRAEFTVFLARALKEDAAL